MGPVRFLPATAISRSFPLVTCGIAAVSPVMVSCTCPLITSLTAGTVPFLGLETRPPVAAKIVIFALCLQPTYGALSDRIGRKALLIWFGVMGTFFTIPLLDALQATKSVLVAFLLIAAAWLIVAGYTSINAVVKAELFPTTVRATGVGLPYAVTVSIFGGTAESIALWFKSVGHERWFYYYLTGLIAISLVIYVTMRDTKRHSAMGQHE